MQPRPDPLAKARWIVLALAVLALAMLLVSGPGTRQGMWGWQAGLALVKWGWFAGIAAAVGALGLLLLLAFPRFRARPWMAVLALCLAVATIAPPLILLGQAKRVPPIHDISTDTADPPAFVGLLEERRKAPNGFAYGGEPVAAQQRRAYADIKPVIVKSAPRETTQRAIDAARAMGWEVVVADAATGRVEAIDTSTWFGFKDDIVVRVRAEGPGSRIDVRSVSRVGMSDLGANAKRIRGFLAKLA
ncbi:MAG: DUF1499 domain-containing protein [Pseudomonadota bacterium]|nr:DUF1499 domain-containing protein [Pseudomonadota bacterium]